MKALRSETIETPEVSLPIVLFEDEGEYLIEVDGVEWLNTEQPHHAVVLFEMMKEHLTEYMRYEKK